MTQRNNSTAKLLLYVAIKQLFQNFHIISEFSTDSHFALDVISEQSIDLRQIQERMEDLIVRDHPLDNLEMAPNVALGYFENERDEWQAIQVEKMIASGAEFTSVAKMGDELMVCGKVLASTRELKLFKLSHVDQLPGGIKRIVGVAAKNKQVLKESQKKRVSSDTGDYIKLFDDGSSVLLPKALRFGEKLLSAFGVDASRVEFYADQNVHRTFSEAFKEGTLLKYALLPNNESYLGDGDLALEQNLVPLYMQVDGNIKTVLDRLVEFGNLLGIPFEMELRVATGMRASAEALRDALLDTQYCELQSEDPLKTSIALTANDSYGRKWKIAEMYMHKEAFQQNVKKSILFFSPFTSLERCIALLLECNKQIEIEQIEREHIARV